jgi:hypothetical protein
MYVRFLPHFPERTLAIRKRQLELISAIAQRFSASIRIYLRSNFVTDFRVSAE